MGSLRVDCDPRGEPVAVVLGDPAALERVAEVVDRWPGSDHDYFRVRTERGDQFILRRDGGAWQVVFYRRRGGEEAT